MIKKKTKMISMTKFEDPYEFWLRIVKFKSLEILKTGEKCPFNRIKRKQNNSN